MRKKFGLKNSEKGTALMEYILIGSLIILAVITGYRAIGNDYGKIYTNISNAIP